MKKFKAKKAVAVLCLCGALCASTGFALAQTPSLFSETALVSAANEQGGEALLDLTKPFNEKSGQPTVDGAANVITFIFPSLNMSDGGFMENAVVSDEGGTTTTVGDYIVVSDGTTEKTVNEWTVQNGGTRAFRVGVYGKALILQFEAQNTISKDNAKWVRFKAGFCLFEGTAGTQADWVLTKTATTKVANTEFSRDLTLFINRNTGKYEHLADETAQDALTITGTAEKSEYFVGDTFDVSGLSVSVKTADGVTEEVPLAAEMCTYDFSEAGDKEVTVSYGGASVSYPVTVQAVNKTVTKIAPKSGYTITYKKFSTTPTIKSGSKLVIYYTDGTYEEDGVTLTEKTEEVDLTADMITKPCPNNTKSSKTTYDIELSYTVYGQTYTCTAKAKCTGDIDNVNSGVNYGGSAISGWNHKIAIPFNIDVDSNPIDNIAGLNSARIDENGKILKLGEMVHVKFSKQTELVGLDTLVSENLVTPGFFGKTLLLRGITDDGAKNKYGDVEYIEIMSGFMWWTAPNGTFPSGNAADTSSYTPRTNCVLMNKTYVSVYNDTVIRAIKEITLTAADTYQKEYGVGDLPATEGLTLSVKYYDQKDTDAPVQIPVTQDMLSGAFTDAGENQTVTLSYMGLTQQITGITVIDVPKPLSISVGELSLTVKRYTQKSQFVLPDNAEITVSMSDGTQKQVALTLDMLGAVDTSSAGDKTCTVTYTEAGVPQTAELPVSVSEEKAPSAIAGINYGADGISPVEGQRCLQIKYNGTVGGHIAYNQLGCAGFIPDKTTGELFLVKVKGQSELKTLASFAGQGGLDFRLYGNTAFVYIPSTEVEYVVLKEGLVLYTYSADDNTGAHKDDYFPMTNENGDIAYVDHDIYLTWTSQSAGDKFGKVAEPLKELTVTLSESAKREYYPGEELSLAGITYTAKYVDPAKSDQTATGSVTLDMCSLVPDAEGAAQITVTLNGTVGTFGITVLHAEKVPQSIALNDRSLLTYQRYAIEPTIKEGCVLVVTYDNGTSKEIPLQKEWITTRPDTSVKSKQNVTITYKEYGVTVSVTVEVQVWEKAVESNIQGVAFGTDENLSGYFGVNFNYAAGGSDGLHALDNIAGLQSAIPSKTNGELVLIKFSNKTELIALSDSALSALQPAFYGGKFVLRETDKLDKNTFGEIEYIVIKAGFLWYDAPENHWGVGNGADTSSYYPVASNVVTKDLYVGFNAEKLEKPVSGIEIEKGENYKTAYIKGEDLSLNFKLVITYLDPGEKAIRVAATREMCGAITGNATAAQAEISYLGQTFVLDGLTYDESTELGGLVVETAGKTQYSFAVEEFDLSGYVVKVIVKDAATGNEIERRLIENEDIEISGFDSHKLGNQTVKLTFSGKETSIDVNVVNDEPEKSMTIEYMAMYDSYDRATLQGLAVHFGFTSEVGNVESKSFLYAADLPNVADKLLINGIPATTLLQEGKIGYIGFYGNVIYVRFPSNLMQPTKDPVKGYGAYEEGVTELVETITFLPGFQFYSVEKDIWPGEWTMDDVTPVKHGVVKETITLENIDFGNGWIRRFKLNEDGTAMADDAMTISSLPVKTQFTVGEEITKDVLLDGLKLHFKYQDGGEEDWQPGVMDIEFEDDISATAGKKLVTVYFKDNDHFVSFEIEVVEKPKNGCNGGCNGSGAGIASGIAALTGIGGALVCIAKKRKGKKGDNE